MPSIFNSLNIGYSGLSAAQVGINTTGHNIANAENEGYTRQRVVTAAATPISSRPGQVGNGTQVEDIKRVFDNFVFDRYSGVSADKEYSDFEKQTLEELSTYFPEIDGVGIKADLAEYYNMWQTFADNPDNDAVKVALASQTETLSRHIASTQDKIQTLQHQINDKLSVNVDEVNRLAKELADVNRSIDTAEAAGIYSANDLRDRRNVMERSLSKLIGADVSPGDLTSDIKVDTNLNVKTGSYTLSINGFNIVDGATYHPLKLSKDTNENGFYSISYERQDGVLIPMEENITNGKIGAILDLRGGVIDTTSGVPKDGIIQNTISQFDAFAKGLAQTTNNIYAQSATTNKQSNILNIDSNSSLVSSDVGINTGEFDVVIYDIDGNEVSRRSIEINERTSLKGLDSIEDQIKANIDDNNDGNANNDVDNFMLFNYQKSSTGELRLDLSVNPQSEAQGYTFSIVDKLADASFSSGTNFAGALGLGRYFDGDSASTIRLTKDLRDNPTKISSGYSSTSGDSRVALDMVQQQFEEYDFEVGNTVYNTTINGMYDMTATYVGISTNSAITKNETVNAQFNATELEYNSVSKVSVDEEMTNLIKYQTSYGAAAKVITTIDQMMQTLLGIKQ